MNVNQEGPLSVNRCDVVKDLQENNNNKDDLLIYFHSNITTQLFHSNLITFYVQHIKSPNVKASLETNITKLTHSNDVNCSH